MKNILYASCFFLLFFTSCEESGTGINIPLTEEEVVAGLKSALEVGTENSVNILNKENGYFGDELVKIFLPPEADAIVANITMIPGGETLIANTIESINRAAEDAAIEAKPIFVGAITSITIEDGFTILRGADTAATSYLKTRTYDDLQNAFQPKIQVSLDKPLLLNESAESLYGNLINSYNSIPRIPFIFDEPLIQENTLSEYATRKALDGVFLKVADEEALIRNEPAKRVNDILKRVFGSL